MAKKKAKIISDPGEHSAPQRRHFIKSEVEKLPASERLEFDKVFEKFNVSDQTLYKDATYFAEQGIPIVAHNKAFKRSYDNLNTLGRRRGTRRAEKEAIARIATALIAGPENLAEREVGEAGEDGRVDFESINAANLGAVLDQPPGSPWQPSDKLAWKLAGYWKKAHKMSVLDAGSTTEAIARGLADIAIPSPARHLSGLRVLTNGTVIVRALAESKHPAGLGVILLGGARRADTDATAGALAEQCLASWAFQADVAVIGSTNVTFGRGFCCDSEEEAQIKSRLLHTARIRCIAADSSKLISQVIGSAWPFAPVANSEIDIIITDWRILEPAYDENDYGSKGFEKIPETKRQAEEARRQVVTKLTESGIWVVIGYPEKSAAV